MPLVLASSSPIRRAMLEAAGVEHHVLPAQIDESLVKQRLSDREEIALELAKAKAETVSSGRPADWVIGSDSVVEAVGRVFDKPRDRRQAIAHLRSFSGQAMQLTSAVALAHGGRVHWSHADTAVLNVRALSDVFIDSYLDAEWPEVGHCVGVFRMEGRGVQLFSRIDGDYFTILGMPLLPLLGALRDRGLLQS